MHFNLNETENEIGLELKAEVDSKNDDVKDMLADLSILPAAPALEREPTPAELEELAKNKAEEKKEREEKKAVKAAGLEKDLPKRMKVWVEGINKDLSKCHMAIAEAQACKDKEKTALCRGLRRMGVGVGSPQEHFRNEPPHPQCHEEVRNCKGREFSGAHADRPSGLVEIFKKMYA